MKLIVAKISIAVFVIGLIAVFVAGQIAPGLAAWKVLLGAGACALLVFVLALVHAYIAGTIRERLLRWGSIDAQWLWSPDYPEGFKRLYLRSSKEIANEPAQGTRPKSP